MEVLGSSIGKSFTIDELCTCAFPDTPIETVHKQSVRRAVHALASKYDLALIRHGRSGSSGWRYVVRMA